MIKFARILTVWILSLIWIASAQAITPEKLTPVLEGGDLYITLGPESWPYRKHKLTHINAHCFGFRSGGAGFKLKFLMEGDVITFDLDLGENENMGLWRASK